HRGAGRIPGRGAPRLHPDGHRLCPDPHRRLPRRGPDQIPALSPGGPGHHAGQESDLSRRVWYLVFGVWQEGWPASASPTTRHKHQTPNTKHQIPRPHMFPFFPPPAPMAIGGSLVSVPIIIHLINRLRYRRIRWAAMEFLLKAQKRNRRRLIIEQIILL